MACLSHFTYSFLESQIVSGMYTPEKAAEFMIDSDFSKYVSSGFTDSGSADEPKLSSESKGEIIESKNEKDIVMEIAAEAQKK